MIDLMERMKLGVKLKKDLKYKLKKEQRNFSWFYKNKFKDPEFVYPRFMQMLSGTCKMDPVIPETIKKYLDEPK